MKINSLLYFSPSWAGGLADYAHRQANALAETGVSVEVLTTPAFEKTRGGRYTVTAALPQPGEGFSKRVRGMGKIINASRLMENARILATHIMDHQYQHVLFGSYYEYLAPIWASKFRKLAKEGTVFGAIVHDPVRDYAVGPLWWHRRSIAAGYSFLREAFVHEEIELDAVSPMPRLRTTVIPHGAYQFPQPTESRESARINLELPEQAHVILSFGHIRDGKNLDLVIRSMVDFPTIYLVVAGKEQSTGQKSIRYYQDLARSLHVENRCRWIHGFIPEDEIGNLFIASDVALLTYSRDFRSASGVLNAAVCYRKRCLASSGGSNLRTVVEKYQLGWFIEPDDLDSLRRGLDLSMRNEIYPQWRAYEEENSWLRNALIVKERMFSL